MLVHGEVVSGSRRWFDLGAFHLQPSELMKVLTLIALSKYIHDTPSLDGRTLSIVLSSAIFSSPNRTVPLVGDPKPMSC